MLACWLAVPALLIALACGCGLLVERIAGIELPGLLLPGVGLAAIIVVAGFTTIAGATAELTAPLVVALAVVGLGLSLPRRLPRPEWWALGAALAVFLVYAAPIALSGKPTFAGYVKLDDTASWVGITDRLMQHGRSLAGLQPSTYQAMLHFYLDSDYPVGAFLPLGIGHVLTRQDSLWLYSPTSRCSRRCSRARCTSCHGRCSRRARAGRPRGSSRPSPRCSSATRCGAV